MREIKFQAYLHHEKQMVQELIDKLRSWKKEREQAKIREWEGMKDGH